MDFNALEAGGTTGRGLHGLHGQAQE